MTAFERYARFKILLVRAMFFWAMVSMRHADAATLELTNASAEYRLGGYVEVLEDPERRLSIDDVRSAEVARRFRPVESDEPVFGLSRSAYWARLSVRTLYTPSDGWWIELSVPSLDNVEFYYPELDAYRVMRSGDELPFGARAYPHRHHIFPIPVDASRSLTVYLKIESKGVMGFRARIWQRSALDQHTQQLELLFVLSYGIVLAMVLYNFFLFLSLQDRGYLYYCFYSFTLGMFMVLDRGIGFQYLWPSSPWFQNVATPVLFGLSSATVIFFTRHFLDTRRYAPALDRVLWLGLLPSFALSVWGALAPSIYTGLAGSILVLTMGPICMIAAFRCWQQGHRSARFYLLAFSAVAIGVMLTQLRTHKVLPDNFVTEYGTHIAMVMEAVLLSFAVADRINILRREKDEAQATALRVLEESERILEEKVEQRTRELSSTNRALANTVQQLSRMNNEKNEFLGTVAHDLNTPLSGVLLTTKGVDAYFERMGSAQLKTTLRDIRSTILQVSGIIAKLIVFGKAEVGATVLDFHRVNLGEIVTAVVRDFEDIACRKRIRIRVEALDDVFVYADGDAVYEVIQNILSNALKFSRSGTEVVVRMSVFGDRACVECIDRGPGLTEDDKMKIFEKYMRGSAKPTGGEQSSGLGLAIAKKLTEAMGGRLWCESVLGAGSSFFIELRIDLSRSPPGGQTARLER